MSANDTLAENSSEKEALGPRSRCADRAEHRQALHARHPSPTPQGPARGGTIRTVSKVELKNPEPAHLLGY